MRSSADFPPKRGASLGARIHASARALSGRRMLIALKMPSMGNSLDGVGADLRHSAGFPAVESRAAFEAEQVHLFSFAERPSLSDLGEAAQGGSAKAAGREGGLQMCRGT